MYSIRTANINDAASICFIAEQTWLAVQVAAAEQQSLQILLDKAYAMDTISWRIGTGAAAYLLIAENRADVGFASYSLLSDQPDTYKIHQLYCLPETQGKGVVKILMDAIVRHITAAGAQRLDIDVYPGKQTKAFYEKIGFRQQHSGECHQLSKKLLFSMCLDF